MYLAGYFYGAISIAQAYVEALSKFLCDTHRIRGTRKDSAKRWNKLLVDNVVTTDVCDAAMSVLSDRNTFHHLNKGVEQDYRNLEKRAEDCINLIHTIESEVFSHAFDAGRIVPKHPERWPGADEGMTLARLRQKW
jgi:hypothetical protein